MPLNDSRETDTEATASGIMHCLRMLAEEADSLELGRTAAALLEAIEICAAEHGCSPVFIEPALPEGTDVPPAPACVH